MGFCARAGAVDARANTASAAAQRALRVFQRKSLPGDNLSILLSAIVRPESDFSAAASLGRPFCSGPMAQFFVAVFRAAREGRFTSACPKLRLLRGAALTYYPSSLWPALQPGLILFASYWSQRSVDAAIARFKETVGLCAS